MLRTRLLATLVALAISAGVLAGCVGAPTTPSAQPQPSGETTSAPAVAPVEVVIETSKGEITLSLRPDKAPKTVANFLKLAGDGFYDGIRVHRVEPGFVVQAGDPLTKGLSAKAVAAIIERQKTKTIKADDPRLGTGGPGWSIPLEISDLVHDRGVIAMARSLDPDSAGSQFYITLGAAHHLDGGYAVFGTVTSGMDVVDSLAIGDEIVSVHVAGGEE